MLKDIVCSILLLIGMFPQDVYEGDDAVRKQEKMLEKDSRSGMLDIFEDIIMTDMKFSGKMEKEIKEFVIDYMEYGDSKNGSLIRTKAVTLAGILVKRGVNDLSLKIVDLSKNDPYYVHKYDGTTGYSMTELLYPVREISSKILKR